MQRCQNIHVTTLAQFIYLLSRLAYACAADLAVSRRNGEAVEVHAGRRGMTGAVVDAV